MKTSCRSNPSDSVSPIVTNTLSDPSPAPPMYATFLYSTSDSVLRTSFRLLYSSENITRGLSNWFIDLSSPSYTSKNIFFFVKSGLNLYPCPLALASAVSTVEEHCVIVHIYHPNLDLEEDYRM